MKRREWEEVLKKQTKEVSKEDLKKLLRRLLVFSVDLSTFALLTYFLYDCLALFGIYIPKFLA